MYLHLQLVQRDMASDTLSGLLEAVKREAGVKVPIRNLKCNLT